jgi:ABC-type uncharacterized transport system involved in gliding motility auxiliary subunit
MSTGATGVRGLQGLQGSYGPRGDTGLTGWTNQPYVNQYGRNPTGPTGTIGLYPQTTTLTVTSGVQTLTLSTPGILYLINSTASGANLNVYTYTDSRAPPVGSFWMFMYSASSAYTDTGFNVYNNPTTYLNFSPQLPPYPTVVIYNGPTSWSKIPVPN